MTGRITCPACGEAYQLPAEFRQSLEGKRLTCCCCDEAFAPFARGGMIGRLRKGEVVPIDLTPYREDPSELAAVPEEVAAQLPPAEDEASEEEPPSAFDPHDETVADRAVVRRASERRMTHGPSIFLVGFEGIAAGRTFKVEKSRTLIGRVVGDLVIADGKASRTHAQLDVTENGQLLLRDLASTNGTTVNGVEITVARLEAGAVIGIGDSRLRVVVKS